MTHYHGGINISLIHLQNAHCIAQHNSNEQILSKVIFE